MQSKIVVDTLKTSKKFKMMKMSNNLVYDDIVRLAKRDRVLDIFRDHPLLQTET
jgi:hypothetical protein